MFGPRLTQGTGGLEAAPLAPDPSSRKARSPMLRQPFFAALDGARRVLVAGAGGGFDVFCGLPLYFALRDAGRQVFLANLSFAPLHRVGRCRSSERCWPASASAST